MGRATGDPTQLLVSPDASEEVQQEMRRSLGLDLPLPEQFAIYVGGLLHGDLGLSIRSRTPVAELIGERLPRSASLAAVAMGIVFAVGLPLGVLAAVRRGTAIDTAVRLFALVGQALPSFVVGIVLIEIFAVDLGWFPASGADSAASYVLPAITLAWFVVAGIVRLLRTSMLEVLDSEFIKLARTKGLAESVVVWKHALRNALLPVVTFAGMYFAVLISLAIIVEVVFAWPGVGRLVYTAILFRDFPVLQGVVLVTGAIVMAVNLAVDLSYAAIDPRVSVRRTTRR